MKKPSISVAYVFSLMAICPWALASEPGPQITSGEAMHRLVDGNARFVRGESTHLNGDAARREQTAAGGQHPFVTILSCSDSRVPLELVFDQGIGDIFVIRVAGNVCGTDEMGSIEYGVDHVGTPLLVVLGHTECGAVKAAATHAEMHGYVKPLVARIAPVVAEAQAAHTELHGIDLVPAVTEGNVWQSVRELFEQSSTIRHCVQSGKVKVVGAIYDVKSGQVKWLGEHPRQRDILKQAN
jgi:carbonic anhydrase